MGLLRATITGTTAGAVTLPIQFSYVLPSPKLRNTVVPTYGGVRVHTAPAIVEPDCTIPWQLTAITHEEYDDLRNFYTLELGASVRFLGYWNDDFWVSFLILDDARIRGQLFDVSGSFQVISVVAWGVPS